MPFILSVKDTYRQAVEAASNGRNTVIYDDKGNPSVMVRFPRYNLSDIDPSWPNTPHPAFIVDGVVKDEILISKFQNIVHNDRAYSLPGMDPAVNLTFNEAKEYCENKGDGWHLMTNAEWAAVALWSWRNGTMPRGNNDYGRDHEAPYETGRETATSSGQTARVATGSGPASWSHDHTNAGIFDLNGNVLEWVDGLRLVNGKIYIHQDNNFNTPDNLSNWVDTGVYIDNTSAGNDNTSSNKVGGSPIFNDKRENPMYTGGDVDSHYAYNHTNFESVAAKEGVTVPELFKYLAIAPFDSEHGGDYFYIRNYGERRAARGGSWGSRAHAGVFALHLHDRESHSPTARGFRSALVL